MAEGRRWDPLDGDQRVTYEQVVLRELVASRIASLMEAQDVSRAELARRMGKSKPWVSKLLDGRRNLQLDTLAEVVAALGVSWEPAPVASGHPLERCSADPALPHWVARTRRR